MIPSDSTENKTGRMSRLTSQGIRDSKSGSVFSALEPANSATVLPWPIQASLRVSQRITEEDHAERCSSETALRRSFIRLRSCLLDSTISDGAFTGMEWGGNSALRQFPRADWDRRMLFFPELFLGNRF